MDTTDEARAAQMEGIAFAGETLGPLFAYDPTDAAVAPLYAALASLDAGEAAEAWPFAGADAVREALGAMAGALADGVGDDLTWEYRRLFCGPGAKAAPPWGSVYTDRETVVFGESTLALRRWMRERGVERLGTEAEPEDHIGTMLLLLAWLARNRPELVGEYLQDHLLTWAPHFLDVMEAEAAQPFLGGLAAITRATLVGMGDELGLSVTVPRFYR